MSDKVKKPRKNAKPAPVAKVKRRATVTPVMIPVIRITNPFNAREFVREELTWRARKSLAAYFPAPAAAESVISINGKIIPRDQFRVTYLDRTDNLVVCPVPTGGGGAKGILTIVAMIAIAVVTAGAGLAIAGAMGLTGTALTVGGAIIQAGISIAGAMLVNAALAPSKPTPNRSEASSATYGADGAKNTSLEGIPVPICYGEFRMAGNVLGMHTENDADDNQTLYMLLSAGEGPVASLTDIEINDNPLVDYKNVEVQTRLGLSTQAPIPWFKDNVVADSKNQKIGADWFYSTTSTAVDQLRFDFVAPQGLCKIDSKSGEANRYTVDLQIQIRPAGSTDEFKDIASAAEIIDWEEVTGSVVRKTGEFYDSATGRAYRYDADGRIVYTDAPELSWVDVWGVAIGKATSAGQFLSQSSPTPIQTPDGVQYVNRVPVYRVGTSMTAHKRAAVRRSFNTVTLDSGKYEVRVRRNTPKSDDQTIIDDIYLSDINEITLDTLIYPNTALVALKIKLSDQISGMPKVTFLNGGRVINVFGRPGTFATEDQWYPAASKNPAWIIWDMLTHRRYGGAMATSRLDFPAFQNWAKYCDEKNLQWNGPIDTEMNVWDASQLVLRVGHSQLVNVGTRYTVVTERPSDPVMMFSVANMIEDSYQETWLATNDRANEIDVTFYDKTNSYKQRTIKVYDPAALTAGAKQRTSAITLYGVTDHETAYKEAQFQLNLNRYILKTINFSAPLEAVACSVGDLIYVQTDMTDWAQAGRLDAGSTASRIQLDREVTMEKGKQYKLLVMRDKVLRARGVVYNVAGTSIFLQDFRGDSVKRLQINGRDLRVSAKFAQNNGYGVVVDDAAGIMPGATYELYDTDVVEEFNVINVPGSSSTLQLQTPMSGAPSQFVNFMFGEAEKVKKPFRIRSITGSHEYKRDISALEYKAEVYDFDRYGSSTPTVPPQDAIIGPVRSLTTYEESYISGETIAVSVVASWAAPIAGMYAGADVYVQRNDGPAEIVDQAKNRTSSVITAKRGDRLVVRVVAYDIFGKRSAYENAPTATYTVLGEVQNIEVGDVTGVGFAWAGRDCKISWRYNSTTHSYEFGSEPVGADAGALDPQFKDYEIRVYDKDHATLRRTEYTTDNSYTYIYDKNFADGVTRHLIFEVRMRDRFNNLGKPALLDAYNAPPTVLRTSITTTFESATLSYTHSGDPDFAGAAVYLSLKEDELADLTKISPVYSGPDTAILIPKLKFDTSYFVRVAPYDAFGMTELKPSSVIKFRTTFLDVSAIADGVLKDSQLMPVLQDRINLIDAPATVVGSVAARVDAESKARVAALLEEARARGTEIKATQQLITDGDTRVANSVQSLSAAMGDSLSVIRNEQTALAKADLAEASQRNLQIAEFDSAIRSYVQSYTYSKADSNSSINEAYNTLRSEFAMGDAATSAYVQSYGYSKSTVDGAFATVNNSIASKIADVNSAVLNEAKARSDAIAAETSQRNEQLAKYNGDIQSWIQNYSYSQATSDYSINQVYSTLRSEFALGDSASAAYVQSYAYSKAETNNAVAQQVNQVTSRLNGAGMGGVTVEQYLSSHASALQGLQGQYTVKIDNNGYISGFGLASTTVNGVPLSEFLIRADVFAVVMPGYQAAKPFTIGAVNGLPRVIISSALIGDASINSAQIADAAITRAKIGAAQVDTLQIAGNAVTAAASAAGGRSCSITMNFLGVPVAIWACGNGAVYGAFQVQLVVEIFRDGILLATATANGIASGNNDSGTWPARMTATPVFIDTPPPGVHTYTFYTNRNLDGVEIQTNAALIETRR
ncbi:phage tail protein [Duganella sp. FT27W]|uniref:phage tail protein n=1 Tax=Duganella sp. FT27W TaxID=2654636 RepID=UPI00128CFF98|nr:phage tail protein [Duganella sp. FT27W]MPQ56311.1 DUF1983 domain-containing protein [Duganella sp. FT27W]